MKLSAAAALRAKNPATNRYSDGQNLYLNVLAEEGILGLLSLIALAIAALATIYRGCHVRDPAGRAICAASGVGIMTLALHSLLDVTLPGPIGLPAFALLAVAAIFIALDREQPRRRFRQAASFASSE